MYLFGGVNDCVVVLINGYMGNFFWFFGSGFLAKEKEVIGEEVRESGIGFYFYVGMYLLGSVLG